MNADPARGGQSSDDLAARECGLALLGGSKNYEDLVVPRSIGLFRRRSLAPHVGPTIAFVARERRFLRAAYVLADEGCELEAEVLLRSLFEFLVCQEWIALNPRRNLALLVRDDQRWKRQWTREVGEILPGIDEVVRSRFTDEQRDEVALYEATLPSVLANVAREVGDEPSGRLPSIYDRAQETGLGFLYLTSYRSASHLSHASMYAIDALSRTTNKGRLQVTAQPPAHREPRGLYVRGAIMLHEALTHAARQWPKLQVDVAESIGKQLLCIQRRRLDRDVPNWRDTFPPETLPASFTE